MSIKVSVLLTTYNRSKLLIKAIKSVLNQTYDNFEVIVVDDASIDDTETILKKLIVEDNRIKYVRHEENKGLSHARNTGLEFSQGQCIFFLDDDDEWLDKNKIQKQVDKYLNSTNNGIFCSSINLLNQNKQNIKVEIKEPLNLKEHILAKNSIIHTSTVMIPRKIIDEIGLFDVNLSRGIDSDMYRRIILRDYKVFFDKNRMVLYREIGSDRITKNDTVDKKIKTIRDQKYILNKYSEHFDQFSKAKVYRYKLILKYYLELYRMTKKNDYRVEAKHISLTILKEQFNIKNLLKYIYYSIRH